LFSGCAVLVSLVVAASSPGVAERKEKETALAREEARLAEIAKARKEVKAVHDRMALALDRGRVILAELAAIAPAARQYCWCAEVCDLDCETRVDSRSAGDRIFISTGGARRCCLAIRLALSTTKVNLMR
jgi:hypothetical protein